MTLTTIGTRGRAGAVRRATDEETPELTGALARVLAHDPVMSWLFRHEANRPGRLERMLGELFLKPAMAYRSAYTTDERAGVALWIPPGKGRLGATEKLGLVPLIARLTGSDLPRALRALCRGHHPAQPGSPSPPGLRAAERDRAAGRRPAALAYVARACARLTALGNRPQGSFPVGLDCR